MEAKQPEPSNTQGSKGQTPTANPYLIIDMRYAKDLPFSAVELAQRVAAEAAKIKVKAIGEDAHGYIVIELNDPMAEAVMAMLSNNDSAPVDPHGPIDEEGTEDGTRA